MQAGGAISFLPLAGPGSATSYQVVGDPRPAGEEPVTDVRVITHEYLQAMGVPLLRGRLFNDLDPADAANKVVINETMARTHWPNGDPIGRRITISWDDDREYQTISVVGDVHYDALDTRPRAAIYWPYLRNPYTFMTIAVRTSGDPATVVNGLRALVREQDPELALADIRTMETVVSDSVTRQRLTTALLGVLAGVALLLAVVGIYGVIAYGVTQRVQEIGIRMALGATRGRVLRLVVGQAAVLAAAGIALGAAGAALLTRLMEGLLFEVEPADPLTFAVVAVVLALAAVAASSLPALRATRVDPASALRAE